MKLSLFSVALCATSWVVATPQLPSTDDSISMRESPFSYSSILEKRKGGGGGGRGGGGGSSGGGRSGSGSGSSGGYSGYSFSSSSNAGGRTRDGSGTPKQYGNQYTGGAVAPYTAGRAAPGGRSPYLLAAGAVAFFPALWLFPVFAYPYPINYHWMDGDRNRTANATCLCEEYSVCGCDNTNNSTFLANVLTNGTGMGAPVNTSMVQTVNYNNGTTISYVNGSLANGTTADGGTDPSNPDEVSPAARIAVNYGGYWIMVVTVIAGVALF